MKNWIDNDRVANGLAPKYAKAAAPNLEHRVSTRAPPAQAPQSEPNPNNLLEYGPNFGLPESETQTTASSETEEKPMTRADLSPTALAIQQDRENSRREPGVQIAMAPGATPPLFAFEPIDSVDVTQFDGPFSNARTTEAPIPPPPRLAPPRMPDIVDPMALSDKEFEDTVAKANEQGVRVGQDAAATQVEVERLKAVLREHQETFRQQMQIGIAEGTGEASQTLPAGSTRKQGARW